MGLQYPHEVRSERAERSIMHERVADAHPRLPRRELRLVDQLVGELHSHELQQRLHKPQLISRSVGVAEHHAVL